MALVTLPATRLADTLASYTPGAAGTAASASGRARREVDWRLLLVAVTVVSAAWVAWYLNRGWIPHDEGTLAQSAERLLQGELPHRDFDEIYTGGLSYLNAAAFRVFGTSLLAMRLVLFAVFLAWVPAVYYIASRFVRPVAAAGVTLLCVGWALPNYPAPLPSWYNLFLTIFGVAALFRWLEDRRPRWLVAAGIAGGLSLLVKVVGLYFVAGVLLFLVFQARENSRAPSGPDERRGWIYPLFVTACLVTFCAALAMVVGRQLHPAEVVHFLVPGVLVAGLLIRNEWAQRADERWAPFVRLARLVAPFFVGFALPIALFVIPFVRGDALGELVNGVFVLPAKRFGVATLPMLSLWSMLALVPVLLLFVYGRRAAGRMTRYHVLGLGLALAAFLVVTGTNAPMYRLVWYAARGLLPVLAIVGVAVMSRPRTADRDTPLLRSRLMILLSVCAVCTLVQFPFSAAIYFCYVAPLAVLLAVALLQHARPMAPAVPAALLLFLVAFAVTRTTGSPLSGKGRLYLPYSPTASLAPPRGGLQVPISQVVRYDALISVLRQHARGGYTWASPDSPEIYFLSGLRNPTRTLFDFFDEQTDRTTRILSALRRHGVTAIVLNGEPPFSGPMPDDLVHAVKERYPFSVDIGVHQVRWQ